MDDVVHYGYWMNIVHILLWHYRLNGHLPLPIRVNDMDYPDLRAAMHCMHLGVDDVDIMVFPDPPGVLKLSWN